MRILKLKCPTYRHPVLQRKNKPSVLTLPERICSGNLNDSINDEYLRIKRDVSTLVQQYA